MPHIDETQLPGVGVRHDFLTRAGERVGIVAHRTGRRDLLVYSTTDPDACRESIPLTGEEATALAGLLSAGQHQPGPVRPAAGSTRQPLDGIPGQSTQIDWVPVPPGSPFAGSSIAAAGVRTVTGVSIVAVLRHGTAFPSPRPDFALQPGDLAVVVGSPEGIDALVELLET